MQVTRCMLTQCPRIAGCAVTVGIFDGVHIGHRLLLGETVYWARRGGAPAVVVTFDTHPGKLLTGAGPPELTTLDERLDILAGLGIDAAVVMPFDDALRHTSAREFVREILVGALGAGTLVTSAIAVIGAQQSGTARALCSMAREFGVGFHAVPAVTVAGVIVSSTAIREYFAAGSLLLAERMLGRPVSLSGLIVDGVDVAGGEGGLVVTFPPEAAVPARGGYVVTIRSGAATVWALAISGSITVGEGQVRAPDVEVEAAGARASTKRMLVFPVEDAGVLAPGRVKVEFVAGAAETDRWADDAPRWWLEGLVERHGDRMPGRRGGG